MDNNSTPLHTPPPCLRRLLQLHNPSLMTGFQVTVVAAGELTPFAGELSCLTFPWVFLRNVENGQVSLGWGKMMKWMMGCGSLKKWRIHTLVWWMLEQKLEFFNHGKERKMKNNGVLRLKKCYKEGRKKRVWGGGN